MDTTIVQQLKSMLSINKNQKQTLQAMVEKHKEWDVLLKHDILHHCLIQEDFPVRSESDNDQTWQQKLIQARRCLDIQNRLAGSLIMVLEKHELRK